MVYVGSAKNVVGGRSFRVSMPFRNYMSLVSHVFSKVVFMVVGMCSSGVDIVWILVEAG